MSQAPKRPEPAPCLGRALSSHTLVFARSVSDDGARHRLSPNKSSSVLCSAITIHGVKRLRRRAFLVVLGGAAASWPLAARAQRAGHVFRIGVAETISAELNAVNLAAFRRGLQEAGYVEGRNLILDYRSADGDATRFPALIS